MEYTLKQLEKLKVKGLTDILKEKKCKGYSGLKRQELIDMILNPPEITLSKTQLAAILTNAGIKIKAVYKREDLLLIAQQNNISLKNSDVDTITKQYVKDISKVQEIDDLFEYSHLTCMDRATMKDYVDKHKHNYNKCEVGNDTYIASGIKYKAPINTVTDDYLAIIDDKVYLLNGLTNTVMMRYDADGYHNLSTDDIDNCIYNNYIPKEPDSLIQEIHLNEDEHLIPIRDIHGYTLEDCI